MHTTADEIAYAALFRHSSVGILISNEAGTIERANPYACKLFGYSESELVGETIELLIPRRLREKHAAERAHYNKAPRPRAIGIGMDLSALKKDGTEFPVEVSLATYETDGKRQIMSFISDITQRKNAEEALKTLNTALEESVAERTRELSQALFELGQIHANLQEEIKERRRAEAEVRRALEREKELNELKSRFVSMASHEFRTPLGGIATSASLIAKYPRSEDEEKRNKHIQTIKRAVQQLTSVLNDFLSLDKLDQGKINCHPSSFSLIEFIKTLLDDMAELSKGGPKILYSHRGEDAAVRLDPDMFRNILMNLLSNAIKYSPADRAVHLSTELHPSHIALAIEDQGIGIPETDQKHLFERFFRAKNAVTIPGTGLGLSIVRQYLDMMGGTIGFKSQENVGTVFTLTFPREPSP